MLPGKSAERRDVSRQLRQSATETERLLWSALRRKGLDGFKFRRQHPVGEFIADFYCAGARLVEVDGGIHHARVAADALAAADAARDAADDAYARDIRRLRVKADALAAIAHVERARSRALSGGAGGTGSALIDIGSARIAAGSAPEEGTGS